MTYAQAKNDVVFWMREDRNSDAFFTTMFDLYALPEDFPDYGSCCSVADPYSRVEKLEEAFKGDIGEQRFVPHIQLHEYEALLFSDPDRLVSQYPDEGKAIHDLISSVSSFKSPELINDGVSTAPSKRILRAIPQYSKTSGGLLVAVEIGLATIRSKCPHFDRWVSCLETLGGVSP